MRKNAEKVIEAFLEGKNCYDRTIRSEDGCIYSYAMEIARRSPSGSLWLISEEDSPSKTTTRHIKACEALFPERLVKRYRENWDWQE